MAEMGYSEIGGIGKLSSETRVESDKPDADIYGKDGTQMSCESWSTSDGVGLSRGRVLTPDVHREGQTIISAYASI